MNRPEDAARLRADVVACALTVLVRQVEQPEVEALLAVLAGEFDGRAGLLVAEQRVEAVDAVGEHGGDVLLLRREGRAAEQAEDLAAAVDERVLDRGHALVEADFVLVEGLPALEGARVGNLFGATVVGRARDLAALDAGAPDLRQPRARAVGEDDQFGHLLGGRVVLVELRLRGLLRRLLLLLLLRVRVLRGGPKRRPGN